jgi:hypothetical protein
MAFWEDMARGGAAGLMSGIGSMAKDLREAFVGKEMTPELQVELQKKMMDLEVASTNAQMQMITAEANSQDKWTSRARPSFMYVFYFVLISLIIVAPLIGVFAPVQMQTFFANVDKGFKAIPDSLYALFGSGYLGYTGFRSFEKIKGATPS